MSHTVSEVVKSLTDAGYQNVSTAQAQANVKRRAELIKAYPELPKLQDRHEAVTQWLHSRPALAVHVAPLAVKQFGDTQRKIILTDRPELATKPLAITAEVMLAWFSWARTIAEWNGYRDAYTPAAPAPHT